MIGASVIRPLALGIFLVCAACAPADVDVPGRPPTISATSVGCVRLEATPAETRVACDAVRDTVLTLEGTTQPALLAELEGSRVMAEIEDGRVWRISVLDPGPMTPDSLGVGSPARALGDLTDVRIFAGEGAYFAVSADHCGLSFQLEGIPFGRAEVGADELAEAPAEVRVARVLIVGECRALR